MVTGLVLLVGGITSPRGFWSVSCRFHCLWQFYLAFFFYIVFFSLLPLTPSIKPIPKRLGNLVTSSRNSTPWLEEAVPAVQQPSLPPPFAKSMRRRKAPLLGVHKTRPFSSLLWLPYHTAHATLPADCPCERPTVVNVKPPSLWRRRADVMLQHGFRTVKACVMFYSSFGLW